MNAVTMESYTCGRICKNQNHLKDATPNVLSIQKSVIWGNVGNEIARFPLQVGRNTLSLKYSDIIYTIKL